MVAVPVGPAVSEDTAVVAQWVAPVHACRTAAEARTLASAVAAAWVAVDLAAAVVAAAISVVSSDLQSWET